MKKALTVLFLAACMQVNAQSDNEFKFGPRIGLNLAKFTEVDDAEMKAGLVFGGYMVYSFHEHFGISADVLYSMEGAKYTSTVNLPPTTVKSENTVSGNYLRIPVMLNLFAGQLGNAVRPKLMLGPQLGFLASAKTESTIETRNGNDVTTTTTTNKSNDGWNTVDFGAVVGAGVNIRLADRLWLDTDLRYYMGASEVFENYPGNDAPKNQNLQLSFGLGIGLNR